MSTQPLCQKCGDPFDPERYALGKRICLDCGEAQAQQQIARKQQSVMPLHKGGVMYLGEGDAAVQYARDITRMRRG